MSLEFMKKILVTGDRGYIGRVLVRQLIKKKYKVVGIDSGFYERRTKTNVKSVNYKKIDKDVRKISSEDLEGIDAIIHLSALSNDPLGQLNSKLTHDINYKASIHLAKLAKMSGVKRFIFSSSCSIYGIAKNGVVNEISRVNPLTEYAKSKIETEKALRKLADDNFFVGLLRNSTVYGYSPAFRNDLVVNNLVTCALANQEIRIMSDGTPWRPLIDVRDLSNIFIEFLETQDQALNGLIINIGFNENNFQVRELVSIISKFLPKCKVVYTGEQGSDSRSYKVKFDLFKKHFPKVKQKWTLDKSVKDLIENLRRNKYSKKDFDNGVNTRLAVLKKLLENNRIDKDLYRTG